MKSPSVNDTRLFGMATVGVLLVSVSLLLFSYTQVDLSLTLGQQSLIKTVQTTFQQIGFYQRPWATLWLVSILLGYASLFLLVVRSIWLGKLNGKQLMVIIGVVVGCLFFAYPAAFSYDIFNYIFTAKTILVYGQNPFQVIPLDFQGVDSMLSFMRWTHLTSAYTPLWILITIPMYLISGNIMLIALFTFKLPAIAAYGVSGWLLYRCLRLLKSDETTALIGSAVFMLNPLILIEAVISGHNDIVMMSLALAAYYWYLKEKKVVAFGLYALSVATKLMTAPLGFLFLIGWKRPLAVILLVLGLLAVLTKREFLPWYCIWILPFTSLLPRSKWLQLGMFSLSLALVSRYLPVVWFGDYGDLTILWRDWLQLGVFLGSVILGGIVFFMDRQAQKLSKRN